MLVLLLVTGCSLLPEVENNRDTGTGFVAAVAGNYDSADTAVLLKKNSAKQTLTFFNLTLGKQYTLTYDGATNFQDKYGEALSLEQIKEGELVDVTFMRSRKRLNSMMLTPGTFRFENATDLSINGNKVYMGKEEYTLNKNMAILTPDGLGEMMDLASVDKLTVIGVDHTIYSIIATEGHGYLRLENESFFIGGWIEITQSLIYPITEEMLLTVPVGTYEVTVSGGGSSGSELVQIENNKEYVLDVSKWQGEEKIGTILFAVSPEQTKIYLDGEAIDASKPQELSYGIHQMIAVADGYETISKYIKVNSEYASMDITLESKNSEGQSVSENTTDDNVSANQVSENAVSENQAGGISNNNVSDNHISGVSNNTVSENQGKMDDKPPLNTPSPKPDDEQTNLATPTPSSSTPKPIISNSGENRVYIDGPEGVEVYVDGSYVGIAPISFPKRIGSHDITLRKAGYQTRTYTISADDTEKDINYSFSDLLPIS